MLERKAERNGRQTGDGTRETGVERERKREKREKGRHEESVGHDPENRYYGDIERFRVQGRNYTTANRCTPSVVFALSPYYSGERVSWREQMLDRRYPSGASVERTSGGDVRRKLAKSSWLNCNDRSTVVPSGTEGSFVFVARAWFLGSNSSRTPRFSLRSTERRIRLRTNTIQVNSGFSYRLIFIKLTDHTNPRFSFAITRSIRKKDEFKSDRFAVEANAE